jgi:hypothetical protein
MRHLLSPDHVILEVQGFCPCSVRLSPFRCGGRGHRRGHRREAGYPRSGWIVAGPRVCDISRRKYILPIRKLSTTSVTGTFKGP